MGDVNNMTAEQAANSGRLEGEKMAAERITEERLHRVISTDGSFYSFSTVEIMYAAKKKWGDKSRRVKALYDLLREMIDAAEKER